MKSINKGTWYHVQLPASHDPKQPMRRLMASDVMKTVVIFSKPIKGTPRVLEEVGSFYINEVTWL